MIPPITDPMGKSWRQPADIGQAPMNATHVLLTRKQLADLPEYSSSTPSGVYPGKCWSSYHHEYTEGAIKPWQENGQWYLKWYATTADPRYCCTEVRIILIGKLKPEKPTMENMVKALLAVRAEMGYMMMQHILRTMGDVGFVGDVPPRLYQAVMERAKLTVLNHQLKKEMK